VLLLLLLLLLLLRLLRLLQMMVTAAATAAAAAAAVVQHAEPMSDPHSAAHCGQLTWYQHKRRPRLLAAAGAVLQLPRFHRAWCTRMLAQVVREADTRLDPGCYAGRHIHCEGVLQL
jgi:hypothetical protein